MVSTNPADLDFYRNWLPLIRAEDYAQIGSDVEVFLAISRSPAEYLSVFSVSHIRKFG